MAGASAALPGRSSTRTTCPLRGGTTHNARTQSSKSPDSRKSAPRSDRGPAARRQPRTPVRRPRSGASRLDNLPQIRHYKGMMRAARLLGVWIIVCTAMACGRADQTTRSFVEHQERSLDRAEDRRPCVRLPDGSQTFARTSLESVRGAECSWSRVSPIRPSTTWISTVAPKPARPGERVRLTFEVFDPWKHHPGRKILRRP